MSYINEIIKRNLEVHGSEFYPVEASNEDFAHLAYAAQSLNGVGESTADHFAREFSQVATNLAHTLNEMQPFLSDCDYQPALNEASESILLAKKVNEKLCKVQFINQRVVSHLVYQKSVTPLIQMAEGEVSTASKIKEFLPEAIEACQEAIGKIGDLNESYTKARFESLIFLNQMIDADLTKKQIETLDQDLEKSIIGADALIQFGEVIPKLSRTIMGHITQMQLKINLITHEVADLQLCLGSLLDSVKFKDRKDTRYLFEIKPSGSLTADFSSTSRKISRGEVEVLMLESLVEEHGKSIVAHNDKAHDLSKDIDSTLDILGLHISQQVAPFIEFNIKKVSIQSMLDAQRDYDSTREKY